MGDKTQHDVWEMYLKQYDAYASGLTPDQQQILHRYTYQNKIFDKFYMRYQDPSAFVDPSSSPGRRQAVPTLDLDWGKVAQWAKAQGYADRVVGPRPGESRFPDGSRAKVVPAPKPDPAQAQHDVIDVLARAIHMQFRPEKYAAPAVNAAPGVHQVE